MVLITQVCGQLFRQFGIRENSGGGLPFHDDPVQIVVDVQFAGIADGVHQADDEFTDFLAGKLSHPREHFGKGE